MLIKEYDFNVHVCDLLRLFKDEPLLFLLQSSLIQEDRGRYSIIGFDPFDIYSDKDTNNLDRLKGKFSKFNNSQKFHNVPLTSGLVGYIGYDYGLAQERIVQNSIDDLNVPNIYFGFYDSLLIVDHLKNSMMITSSGLPETDDLLKELRAKERIAYIEEKLLHLESEGNQVVYEMNSNADVMLSSNFTKEQYEETVNRALGYISEGDIYQVNLSQRFCLKPHLDIDPILLYQILTQTSPSSFGVYFDGGAFQILSSSPERFLHLRDSNVTTRPMKGTRPRGVTKEDDLKYKREIINSIKDKAELLMITDLLRNDLGRVCNYGSIEVDEMRTIEEYKTVYQATSSVRGVLQEGKDCFDLIQACFPGGSITGCPKIRSMEIIEELEPHCRGIYTGSFGYIDFNGNMDLNILIRTLVAKDNSIYFQVGGGIVADSTAQGEYEETLIKAKGMKDALLRSQLIHSKNTSPKTENFSQ